MKTRASKASNGAVQAEVLTLPEAAQFLRVSESTIQDLVSSGSIPCREIGGEARFLKRALKDWLRGEPTWKQRLMSIAGKYAGDESLAEIRKEIYRLRGRPESDDEAD